MKINLNGYEGVPESEVADFRALQEIELISNLHLEKVLITFTSSNGEEISLTINEANGVKIPVPEAVLQDETYLIINVSLIVRGVTARKWTGRPILLNKEQDPLNGQIIDYLKVVKQLSERVTTLEELTKKQSLEIAMLKDRINPIKEITRGENK